MQFIAPIGFLALAGLIIPVLIHLSNVRQGKTLKIGSIALLGEKAKTTSKSFTLTELLLFALRCLILILIASLLAQPYLKNKRVAEQNKGWILADKSQFSEIYKEHSKTIDSLLTLGFELRDFNASFNQFSAEETYEANVVSSGLNYISLLNQLNKEIPAGYLAYLFADRRLIKFNGDLPKLNFRLIWKETNYRDTVKNWSTIFLDKVYRATSTPSLTTYTAKQSQSLQEIKVMVYDPRGIDSKYIKAGLRAIADFTKRKIEIITSASEADVIFWLSEQPIVLEKQKQDVRIINYRKGSTEALNSIINVIPETNQTIALNKRIVFDDLPGSVIWSDGYGQPLMVKEFKRNHFHFYSRFDPQWTDLVWDEQFVSALVPLVFRDMAYARFGFEDNYADQRVVAKMEFSKASHDESQSPTLTITENIDYLFWMLAFVVLIIERVVSFWHKNGKYANS